jgi:hypothetical protein
MLGRCGPGKTRRLSLPRTRCHGIKTPPVVACPPVAASFPVLLSPGLLVGAFFICALRSPDVGRTSGLNNRGVVGETGAAFPRHLSEGGS